MHSILIKNGHVIDPANHIDCLSDILVSDGRIAAVGMVNGLPEGTREIDAAGCCVVPGLVDMHVHLRDPGQTHKEDIMSGCRAAAAGGVTSLLTMPNTSPAMDCGEVVSDMLRRAEKADAHVYAAAAVTKGLKGAVPTDLEELREAGAIALSDDGRPVENTRFLAHAMRKAARLGMKVTAHCEDLYLAQGGLMHEGKISRQLGIPGIPAAAEDAGTAREISLAAAYGVPVHICHVSTATSVALIRDAKRRGVPVTAETCPHYFALTEEMLLTRDGDYRMNPPLRSQADRLAVIDGILDGTLDAIATDHAPHTPEEKSDFLHAPNGSIGMETSLAVSLTWLVHGRDGLPLISIPRLIELMSLRPARILNIPAGTLSVGAPADIAVFDPNFEWTVDPSRFHGKSRNCPFKGKQLKGKVLATVCSGRLVFDEGLSHRTLSK